MKRNLSSQNFFPVRLRGTEILRNQMLTKLQTVLQRRTSVMETGREVNYISVPTAVKHSEAEKPQLSELLPSQTEGNRDSEESDADKTSNCSSETDVSDGHWEESEAQSDLNSMKNDAVPVVDRKCGKSKKLHICPDCGKTFRSRQGLLGHHRIHTGENPFSCSICKKPFSSKGNLQKHSKVHTGERPFKCSVCGTALKSKNALIEHTRIHTGEKPFRCSVCGRSFSFRSYLTVHMKCHSEEKPYSCSLCTAAFKRKNVLLAHVKTHTGENCPSVTKPLHGITLCHNT
uniref:C2H2-type domain-containing protein n=1 Tax=Poecilia mexicana TaxID=48701 RepID=A0A3B3XC52_9TELE